MGLIAQAEDALLTAVDAALPGVLRQMASIPGGWTLERLQQALQFAPGVYVAFVGGKPADGDWMMNLHGRFELYAVTKEPIEQFRRRGGPGLQIGAYDIIEALAPAIHGMLFPGFGTAKITDVRNLFNEPARSMGGTVYGLALDLPINIDKTTPPNLGDFLHFRADYDIPPFDTAAHHEQWIVGDYAESRPDSQDGVDLPGP